MEEEEGEEEQEEVETLEDLVLEGTMFVSQEPGLEITLDYATSAAAMAIVHQGLVLARNTARLYRLRQLQGGMGFHSPGRITHILGFAALHATMAIVHQLPVGLDNLVGFHFVDV